MKVAILCSGLGRVVRGFERFAGDLAMHLGDRAELTVFGGGHPTGGADFVQVRCFSRQGVLSHVPLVRASATRGPYYWETLSFTASILPRLLREKYDVVHVMDPPMMNFLHHFNRAVRLPWPVVLTNGVAMTPDICARADHIHQVSLITYDEAIEYGLSKNKMTLIPLAIDEDLFTPDLPRHEARERLGIKIDAPLILTVAAVNRLKRIDHLIDETALTSAALLVVGHLEDHALLRRGSERLGDRFIHRRLPPDEVVTAYRAADAFVLASLQEGFGISLVEAMMASIPVLATDAPHFRWVVGDHGSYFDPIAPGALAEKVNLLLADPPTKDQLSAQRSEAMRRFSWKYLVPLYIEMYQRAITRKGRWVQ